MSRPLVDCALEVVSGIPVVPLRIAGSGPLLAILDTGFENNILDRDVARRLRLTFGATRREAQPGGALETAPLAPVAVDVGGFRVPRVRFDTLPIAPLGLYLGRPLAAILGHTFFERFVVEIDYPAGRLRLGEPRGWRYTGPARPLPVRFHRNQVLLPGTLELPRGRALVAEYKLDTGSMEVAGLALNYVRGAKVIGPGVRDWPSSGVAVGGGTEARVFRARGFQLGPTRVEAPTIGYVVSAAGFENRDFAGVVGAGVLTRGRLILDYPRRRIVLEPRPGAALLEDLSGLQLGSPPPDFSDVQVLSVFPGSAAEGAGLSAGDALLAIDGESCSLARARRLLQMPQTRTLHYRRADREYVTSLTPRLHPPP